MMPPDAGTRNSEVVVACAVVYMEVDSEAKDWFVVVMERKLWHLVDLVLIFISMNVDLPKDGQFDIQAPLVSSSPQ